jgi:hypothetical protein
MPSGSQHSIVERDPAVKRRCAERKLVETPEKQTLAFFLFVEKQRTRQVKKTHKKRKKRAPEQAHTLHVMTCPAFRDSPTSPSAIKVTPLITLVITYVHLYPKLISTLNLQTPSRHFLPSSISSSCHTDFVDKIRKCR